MNISQIYFKISRFKKWFDLELLSVVLLKLLKLPFFLRDSLQQFLQLSTRIYNALGINKLCY